MSRLRRTVIPFRWNPLTVAFTQGTVSSVNLSVFLSNPWGYPITFGAVGALPSGVTLSGSTVSYNGLGAAASAIVRFTAFSGQYQATVTTTVTITASTTVNTKPTWRTGTPTTLGSFVRSVGGSFNLSLWSFDAEADPIRYYRTGGIEDTAPSTVTVNEITGIVTIPVGVTLGNYGVGVVLSDGQSFSDPRTFTLTIANTPPVFTVVPPSPQIVSSSGGQLQFTATDADGDALTYSLSPARAGFSINPSTGLVSITSQAANSTGVITVTASDGAVTASATCDVSVAASTITPAAFDDGFESAVLSTTLYALDTDETGETSTTHAREGSRSFHSKLTKSGTTKSRSEVKIKSLTNNTAWAGSPEYWLGFSVFIPTASDLTSLSHIFQWHTQSGTSGVSPVLGIAILGGQFYVHREVGANGNFPIGGFASVTQDQWQDFVFRVLWRDTAVGLIQLWHNGTKVYDASNTITQWSGESVMPYPKCGRYSSSWRGLGNTDPNGTIHETYHDAIRVLQGNDLFNAVAPRGNRLSAF